VALLLSSGENAEWVARTLGHFSTEMLFKVYSRYYPFTHYGSGLVLLDQRDELLPWNDTVRALGDNFRFIALRAGVTGLSTWKKR